MRETCWPVGMMSSECALLGSRLLQNMQCEMSVHTEGVAPYKVLSISAFTCQVGTFSSSFPTSSQPAHMSKQDKKLVCFFSSKWKELDLTDEISDFFSVVIAGPLYLKKFSFEILVR